MKKLCVITGEASGDLHGANLIRALKKKDPSLEIHAVGGHNIQETHPSSFIPMAHTNVTGVTEVLRFLPEFFRLFGKIEKHVQSLKPDLVVFIDNPGFNLRLARRLEKAKIPLLYYICPQVWAWKESRVNLMKKLFKKALVIFDFEEDFYKKRGMDAIWVGHPLLDNTPDPDKKEKKDNRHEVLLMPGSRKNELNALLPILLKAAWILKKNDPELKFTLLKAQTLSDADYEAFLSQTSLEINTVRSNPEDVMRRASLALVCSGTATLECTLFQLPMIVLYRVSWLTGVLARYFIKIPFVAIPNIIAKEAVVPELLQEDCTPEKISNEALGFLKNVERLSQTKRNLGSIRNRLGTPGATERAANAILAEI